MNNNILSTCDDCGREIRIVWFVNDESWLMVMGSEHMKMICLDCYLKRADKVGIILTREDFKHVTLLRETVMDDVFLLDYPKGESLHR